MQPVEKASARRLPRQLSSFRLQSHFYIIMMMGDDKERCFVIMMIKMRV